MKILAVINPRSGKGRAEGLRETAIALAKQRGDELEVRIIAAQGDGMRFAQEAKGSGFERIISIGGDGTLNAIAAGMVGSTLQLGIVPMGSGNGYARSLKLPQDPVNALEVAFSGNARLLDVCYLNDRLFLGTAGIGFDAQVAWEFDKSEGRGMWNYMRLIVKHVLSAKPMRVVLKVNKKTREEKVLMLVFCNTREFGNGAVISPGSLPDDGMAELRIVAKPPLLPMLMAFIRMYTGSIDASPYLTSIVTDQATVHQDGILAHLDGEPLEIGQDIQFRLEAKQLWVVVE